jgi:hypothetical protein
VFCDIDWAGDSETRISVTGFILYLINVPVCWRSKLQKGITLSSTEAKFVATYITNFVILALKLSCRLL